MRWLWIVVLAASAALGTADRARAQAEERVLVPDVPGGSANVRGCYQGDRKIYGPYIMSFCLEKPGTYKIRGAGIKCDGRVAWETKGKYVNVAVKRQSCNKGVAWAEGSMSCRPRSKLDVIMDDLSSQSSTRTIVPDNKPKVKVFKCTYDPSVKGEPTLYFFAYRQ